MKQGMKAIKAITAVLVLALLVVIGGFAFSKESVRADAVTGNGWSYENGVLTVSDGAAFEAGNDRWKQYSNSITEVVIDNSIKVLPEGAFASCSKLQKINLSHVTSIGRSAFSELTKLENIDLSSVTEIGDRAFINCKSLTSISLPNVKKIDPMTFYHCTGLKSVELGSNLQTIGEGAFGECIALETINLSSVTTIDENAFFKCENLTEVNLSAATLIGQGVFRKCTSLSSVVLGENLTGISAYAFFECENLESVDLSYVETVGDYAFSGCTSLSEVTMGEDLTTLGAYAFDRCSALRSIDLSYVKDLGEYCFNQCSGWNEESEEGFGLEEVILGEGITTIPDSAFSECGKLSDINLGKVENIGDSAFFYCYSLTYVDFSSVKSIGYDAFSCCSSLSGIDLSSVKSINDGAFDNCYSLTEVDLSSATWIGDYAFSYCEKLNTLTISNRVVRVDWSTFDNSPIETVYFIGSESQYHQIFGYASFDQAIVEFSAFEVEFYTEYFEPVARQTIAKGDKAVAPQDPEMDDHLFTGWYLDADCKVIFDFDTPVTKNLKLHAGWMEKNTDAGVFKGHSLSLEDDIGVKFYVELPSGISSNAHMEFTVEGISGKQAVPVQDAQTVTVNGVIYKMFKCSVPAKNMTSVIHADLVDNKEILASNEYTVKEYAKYIIDHQDQYSGALIRLVKDMVNYGAAAQTYFGTNKNNLANSFLSDYERSVRYFTCSNSFDPYEDCYLPEGMQFCAVSLSLKSNTVLNLYFTDAYDRKVTFYYNGQELKQQDSKGRMLIQISDIPAHMIRESFEVTVKVEGDDKEYVLCYSPVYYCHDILFMDGMSEDFKNVMRHFYLYSGSAEAFMEI